MSARRIPMYESSRHSVSGVEAVVKPGDDPKGTSATWHVAANTLCGVKPEVGAQMIGADGLKWIIRNVGPLTDGRYPCLCDRVMPEGGE